MDWQEIFSRVKEILDFELFLVGETSITLSTFAVFATLIALTLIFARIVERGLDRFFAKRQFASPGTTGALRRLLYYFLVVVGVVVALNTVGIHLATLFTAGAVFAVGVGFALQNILQNFVSGILLLAERTIKPGDVLEVEGRVVRVVTMGVRTTIVRTRDEEDLIVPNSLLVQSPVKNFTLREASYRLRARVGVTYSSDMKKVRETLLEVAKTIPWRSPDWDPVLLLVGFGDSSVNFELSVWVDDPWRSQQLLSKLHEIVWWALKDAGIVIAFPQLDVHFDSSFETPVVRSLEAAYG